MPTHSTTYGVMYAKGEGVKKDEAEAVKWYTKAAQQGHALAQVNLGLMYHNKDEAEAVKWWTLAALLGHAKAQFFLGVMYAKGEGVIRDEAEAVKWYTKAAQSRRCQRTV